MMKRSASFATLFTLLFAGAAIGSDGGSFLRGSEITAEAVLTQMNFYRGLHRLPALRLDERLSAAAEDRMRDMEELEYWAHDSPHGRRPFEWLAPHRYVFRTAGENLASGFETAEIMVVSWMESAGHRRNIVSPDFKDVGIAIIDGATNRRSVGRSIVVLFASEQQAAISKSASKDLPRAPSD